MKKYYAIAILIMTAMIFIAAPVSAITPDKWQERINSSGNYESIPSGELAILNDCGFTTKIDNLEYKILFGAVHGVRISAPNLPHYPGNNFVIHLGYGENGYTGPWGYEVFVEPRPRTFFTVVIGRIKMNSVWFLQWNQISAEEFKKHCEEKVPYQIGGEYNTYSEKK